MGDTFVVSTNGDTGLRRIDRGVGLKEALAAMPTGALGDGLINLMVRRTVSYGTRYERKTGVTRVLHHRISFMVATYCTLSGGWVAATEEAAALVGAVVNDVYHKVPPPYVKPV